MLRLALAFFAAQAGFHGFTASLPVALVNAGASEAQIGLVVGVAWIVQIPAAFVSGALIDRLGGPRLLIAGSMAYLAGALVVALPGVEPADPGPAFLLARALQGIGISMVPPSVYATVPTLVPRNRVGLGLAQAGMAQNLTMAILPPVSLVVLSATSFHVVAALVAGLVSVGLVLALSFARRTSTGRAGSAAMTGPGAEQGVPAARRWVGFAYRRSWTLPLLLVTAFGTHWGVALAFLATRTEPLNVNVGLFFMFDAVAVFLVRMPVGWAIDRISPRPFLLLGNAITALSVLLLLAEPTNVLMIASGLLAGAGGIMAFSPILMVLSHRSGERDRGSAFALVSVTMALSGAIGSIGGAPIMTSSGFVSTMVILGLIPLGISALLAIVDPGLGQRSGVLAPSARAVVAGSRGS